MIRGKNASKFHEKTATSCAMWPTNAPNDRSTHDEMVSGYFKSKTNRTATPYPCIRLWFESMKTMPILLNANSIENKKNSKYCHFFLLAGRKSLVWKKPRERKNIERKFTWNSITWKKNPKRSASFVRISVRLRLEPFLSSSIDRVCVNFCMCLLLNENTTESQTNIQP